MKKKTRVSGKLVTIVASRVDPVSKNLTINCVLNELKENLVYLNKSYIE